MVTITIYHNSGDELTLHGEQNAEMKKLIKSELERRNWLEDECNIKTVKDTEVNQK